MPTSFSERRPRNWHRGSSSLILRQFMLSFSLSSTKGQNKSKPSDARLRGIKSQAAPPRNARSGLASVPSCQIAGKGDEARDSRRGDGITSRGDGVLGRSGNEKGRRGDTGAGEAGTSVVSTDVSFGLSERFSGEWKGRRDATDAVDLASQFRDVTGFAGARVLTGEGERKVRLNSLKREDFDTEARR